MEIPKRKVVSEDETVISFINTETGEREFILREGDSIKIDTREQKEKRANHKKIKTKNSFVKVFKDTIQLLIDEDLTKSELRIILVSLAYLDATSGILTENGINISKARFLEITNITHNTFSTSINHLIELQIMARTKIGRQSVYLLNPFIFLNGQYINNTLYGIFKKSK